jgi:Chalcone isomerase-like
MQRFLRGFAIGMLIVSMTGPVRAAECIGVTKPDQYQLGGDTLVLNGLGARLATMLKVQVYVAGLYLKEHVHDPQAIIATDQPRHLELDFLRDVTRKQITAAWTEGFKKNAGDKFASLAGGVDALNAAMTDLPKGSKLTFSYQPGVGTAVTINEQSKAVIAGADFASALISIWLGDPPNKEIKTGLLGGDCD